ncbi:F-box/kelch-repeat protein [Camellia lanceoleosa]|uniref:F-box/kelch-repeat protein n=1 Tax=Camellia lanceoleosa TaxID=1840588 RepID=A0ACC0FAV7_9ERIC|nr:F-box/kelch-repeat protein [Camellia lanceoleosa]
MVGCLCLEVNTLCSSSIPSPMQKIDLPDLPEYYYFDTASFSYVPTSLDCTLFGILGLFNDIAWFSSISRGEESWTWAKVNSNLNFQPSHSNPVFYNELFYCLGQDCNLGVFNPKEEDSSWTVLDGPKKPRGCDSVHESYLMECDGKLLSVCVGNRGGGVPVYTLDESEIAWQRVTDLGSKVVCMDPLAVTSVKRTFVAQKSSYTAVGLSQ